MEPVKLLVHVYIDFGEQECDKIGREDQNLKITESPEYIMYTSRAHVKWYRIETCKKLTHNKPSIFELIFEIKL